MSARVIGFHYELKDTAGTVLDSSFGQDPFLFLEDQQQIIPGLEKELKKLNKGDKKVIEVKAPEAYGDIRADLVMTVKKDQFPSGRNVQVGDRFQVNNHPDNPVFEVKKIEENDVHIDGNHPLAGKDLFFNVEVIEMRTATAEELAHGHAHGPDGHHHH
ncbi:MAG: FKBP-type peptidyl-prolyl cis-trans isomerase [Bacteriovoracaceae bacterium]